MGRPEAILERRRRKRTKIAERDIAKVSELNSYIGGNPNYDLKAGLVAEIAFADNLEQADPPLNKLANALEVSERISVNQLNSFLHGLGYTKVCPYEGHRNSQDPIRHSINTDGRLQASSLVNIHKARSSQNPSEELDLLVSTFNLAHMAADKEAYLTDWDDTAKAASAIRRSFKDIVAFREAMISDLARFGVINQHSHELLQEATSIDQLLNTPKGDYLLVLPFRKAILSAPNIAEAFKQAQELIYLGYAIGTKQLGAAKEEEYKLRAESYEDKKLTSMPNPYRYDSKIFNL